ncbi:MAG: hypothetical protein KGD65_12505 [Candidatus Lokiarchaeota archaeon]|nr:hypothetical protein [Candidatus Lokiarchaeota archaeon]
MPTLVNLVGSPILQVVSLLIEYGMMVFFIFVLMYPLNTVYRRTEIGFKEILLSSPATTGDIFLGEFVGKFPIYTVMLLITTPLIIGLINPIVNLNWIQYCIIYLCIFGMLIFAALIGSIISSLLEHKIAKSERARDLGKVLMFILSIAIIALIYSLQFLFSFLINNPQLRNWVSFYPSLWFSNIILYFIEPSLISSYFLNIWYSFALAIIVPSFTLYIAYKKADKFFTVEGGIEKISSIIKKENKFYVLVRKLTGHKWEGLIITQLKEFLRKKETIMNIIYVCGITGVLGVVFSFTMGTIELMGQSIIIVLIIIMGGMMYGLLFGSYIFVGSKDLIWTYKRSPRNVRALVYSYILTMLIFNIMMTIGLTIFFAVFFEFDIPTVVFFFTFYLIYNQLVIFQAIGIQCFSPSFEEKGRTMTTNNLVLMVLQMVPFQFIFILLLVIFEPPTSPELAKFYFLNPMLLLSAVIAIPLLFFGIKHLSKIE